jgi:hypothetical protein
MMVAAERQDPFFAKEQQPVGETTGTTGRLLALVKLLFFI